MREFLPYGRQTIDDDDVAAVVAALREEYLTGGSSVTRFERAFAEAVGATHAVVCANGTAALHLAALGLEIGPGDSVIVPAITFLASANAFRFQGANIVFADVDPQTGLMTPQTLADAIAELPASGRRAVVAVHLGGRCSAPEELAAVARSADAVVVEDACHAVGTAYRRSDGSARRVGACADSDLAVFSLHPVKTITMGEGGVVTTGDSDLAERVRGLRNHAMVREPDEFQNRQMAMDAAGQPNPWYYEMDELGLNYRASDIQCALGLSQLSKLDRFAERRRSLAARYDALLAPLAPAVRPNAAVPGCDPVLHLYAVRIGFAAIGLDRATLIYRLRDAGIGTQVHYIPVHLQPYYRRIGNRRPLHGAEAYYAATLSLPLFPAMQDDDVDRVVEALADAIGARRCRHEAANQAEIGT